MFITTAAPNVNVSHRVRAELIAIHYATSTGSATIHRTGCAHASKADEVRELGAAAAYEVLADDWFNVAPCARKAVAL